MLISLRKKNTNVIIMSNRRYFLLTILLFLQPISDAAAHESGIQLTDRLRLNTTIELVHLQINNERDGHGDQHDDENAQVYIFDFNAQFHERISGVFLFEAEHNDAEFISFIDEAHLQIDLGWGDLKFGKQYVSFGKFATSFYADPLTLFAETNRNAFLTAFSINETVTLSAYASDSKASDTTSDDGYDFGMSVDLNLFDDRLQIGSAYLSDLAESGAELLCENDNRYQQRVAAATLYAHWHLDSFSMFAEYITALEHYRELDSNANHPRAAHIELGWQYSDDLSFAVRYEYSDELSDAPEQQYGLSATWQALPYLSLIADYLYADYKNNFVFDDDGIALEHSHLFGVQAVFEF